MTTPAPVTPGAGDEPDGAAEPGRVLVEDRGAVRFLLLSNPAKRNALTRPMLSALADALPSAAPSDEQPIRSVVLAGDPAGRAFSAGFDLAAIDEGERQRGLDPIDAPATAIERAPVPVIAAIEGLAFGGALEIACACDVRIAARGARLCMPPARIGLVYAAAGLSRFLRLCGAGACRRLFLTGHVAPAEEAQVLGLVEGLAEPGEAMTLATRWAEEIAANAPLAVAGLREAIGTLALGAPPSADALAALARARERSVRSEDLAEGVRAFHEKRPPRFRGR